MPRSLPIRANLDWLRKTSKQRLARLRETDPNARLADAQRDVAREYGAPSWRKLREQVELRIAAVPPLPPDVAERARAVAPDDPDLTRLMSLIDTGDADAVARLLATRPELAQARDADGRAPLHAAAWRNDARVAIVLLAFGADADATHGDSGHSAMSWAVTCHALDFASALSRLGYPPDLFCASGMGAIDDVRDAFDASSAVRPGASRSGSSRLADDGRRLPCPPETPREVVSDALYIACRNNQEDVVRFLLERAPDLAFRAYMGGTPLHWAYFGGSATIVNRLLAAGADPTLRDTSLRCTPRAFGVCAPASWGFVEKVRERLAADPSLATLHDLTTTPLHAAARGGNRDVIDLLLAAGADRRARDDSGQTPADLARARGHMLAAELLEPTDDQ